MPIARPAEPVAIARIAMNGFAMIRAAKLSLCSSARGGTSLDRNCARKVGGEGSVGSRVGEMRRVPVWDAASRVGIECAR